MPLPELPFEFEDPWWEKRNAFDLEVKNQIENLLASKIYVDAAIAALVSSSPAALDTLNELATALGNDPNFATTITNLIAGKAPLSHSHPASDIASGVIAAARLPTATTSAAGILPLATAPEAQAMTDGGKLITAQALGQAGSQTPVATRLARYSSSSRLQSANPSVGDDVANKTYVDGKVGTYSLGPIANLRSAILPGDTWMSVFDPGFYSASGQWSSSDNGILCLSPVEAARDYTLSGVALNVITAADGTGHFGVWASNSAGEPTGLPVWTSSPSMTTTGNKIITTPAVAMPRGTRLWLGWLSLGWTVGVIRQQVATNGTGDMPSAHGSLAGTDINGYLIPTTNPVRFPLTRLVTGLTDINTDLTSASYTTTGRRPHIGVRLTRV